MPTVIVDITAQGGIEEALNIWDIRYPANNGNSVATSANPNNWSVLRNSTTNPTSAIVTYPDNATAGGYKLVIYTQDNVAHSAFSQVNFGVPWTPPPAQHACVQGVQADLVAAGFIIVSGPHATQEACEAACN